MEREYSVAPDIEQESSNRFTAGARRIGSRVLANINLGVFDLVHASAEKQDAAPKYDKN